jgi:hypothetical protein
MKLNELYIPSQEFLEAKTRRELNEEEDNSKNFK